MSRKHKAPTWREFREMVDRLLADAGRDDETAVVVFDEYDRAAGNNGATVYLNDEGELEIGS